ncbi:UDP-N-acetylglucosamine-transferase [Gammaproteobacteria bacterium]|nr:UDP-N-acetylglucosamine-transferase [Gammaproteobacteria bacterium]|tara:strand:- start:2808 stop:3809 length:1002 start_codon:yes stop_codon:yes gene_type:complete
MKIFISIASYQDPLLVSTIFGAYNNAQNKDGLIFSICDQADNPVIIDDLPFSDQVKYEHVDPVFSKGPCWARQRAQSFYQDEEYFLQIDSHTQFLPGWDILFRDSFLKIEALGSSDPYFAKPIITSYPRPFQVIDFEKGLFELNTGDKDTQVIAYRKDSLFSRGSFSRQIGIPTEHNKITHAYLMAAGCIFTRGQFIKEIPYDPNYYFYGEELSMALRAFTRGYSFFHIPDVPLFHLYTDVSNVPRKLHWDPDDDKNRAIKWHELEQRSLERLDDLFANKIGGSMGLGSERSLEDYAIISGMDLKNKKVLDLSKATESTFLESTDWRINPIKK